MSMKKVLFVQSQEAWVESLKKAFNGNYRRTAQFDFRRTPRAAVGRLVYGLKYNIFLIDYGWSVDGLRKQIQDLSPESTVYTYSQLQYQPRKYNGTLLIKKDLNYFIKVLEENGIISDDKHK